MRNPGSVTLREPGLAARHCALLLLALALVAYLPALGGDFLWDDDDWIVDNDALRSWHGLWRIWAEPGAVIQYYPLTYTSWWLDVQVWGLWPVAFHVENVLLHALNGLLLLLVLRRLALPGALLAAVVFVLHPTHTESVAWIVERKNVLSTALYLGATLAWLRHLETPRRSVMIAAIALFALAVLAKSATLMLPAALLLLTTWRAPVRARLVELLPFFALSLLSAWMTVRMERGAGALGEEWSLDFAQRCVLAGLLVWFYLGTVLWPVGLCFQYPKWSVDAGSLTAWLPLVAVPVALAVPWLLRARLALATTVATGWFVVNLFPVLGLFDFYWQRYAWAADHFVYLSSMAPIAAIAALVARAPGRVPLAIGAAAAIALGAGTWARAGTYDNVETLWRRTLATNPDAWLAHTNLGNLLLDAGDVDAGIGHHRRALEVYPRAYNANNAMGNWLAEQRRFDAARMHLEVALEVRPHHPDTYNNLGVLEGRRRDYVAARGWFERGLAIAPNDRATLRNLAQLLSTVPDPEARDPARALELARRLCAGATEPTALDLFVLFRALLVAGQRSEARSVAPRALEAARRSGDPALEQRIRAQLQRLDR